MVITAFGNAVFEIVWMIKSWNLWVNIMTYIALSFIGVFCRYGRILNYCICLYIWWYICI